MVIEGDLAWDVEHSIQCTNDVLWNCAPETCIISLTSITPINSIKKKTETKIERKKENHGKE